MSVAVDVHVVELRKVCTFDGQVDAGLAGLQAQFDYHRMTTVETMMDS